MLTLYSSNSEVLPPFKGCIIHARVVNYKPLDDPEPFAVTPIALYLQHKSRFIEERNVLPCDYVPTTPRSAGQRMSETSKNGANEIATCFKIIREPVTVKLFNPIPPGGGGGGGAESARGL